MVDSDLVFDLDPYLEKLRRRLNSMPRQHQLLFCLSCLTRLRSGFETWLARRPQAAGRLDVLSKEISDCLTNAASNASNKDECVNELISRLRIESTLLDTNTPSADELAAQDYVYGLDSALRSLRGRTVENIARVAEIEKSAIDNKINAGRTEFLPFEQIMMHPLMRAMIASHDKDLETLKGPTPTREES